MGNYTEYPQGRPPKPADPEQAAAWEFTKRLFDLKRQSKQHDVDPEPSPIVDEVPGDDDLADAPIEMFGLEDHPAVEEPQDVVPAGDQSKTRRLTDSGLAERFADSHRRDVRYCWPWGAWIIWNGRHWQRDDSGTIHALGKRTVRGIYSEAARCQDEDVRKALANFATQSESGSKRRVMLELARSEDGIPISPADLDIRPMLLNLTNGVIDLETMQMRPHCREDYLTRCSPVVRDPDAKCPIWLRFLGDITCKDEDLQAFLRRSVGYALTGMITEQVLWILHGIGANGKTVFTNTVLSLLGEDYGIKASTELLMAQRPGGHPTGLTDLHGRRLACCSESEDGRRLAEPLVKELTGGEPVRARRMREDYWEFKPTHKVWLATNHKPVVRGTDFAIWRRIRLVPFARVFEDREQDKGLTDKLRAELPGVLNWALEGCVEWMRDGLGMPSAVEQATQEYRTSQDVLGAFFDECCLLGDGYEVGASDLYSTYKTYCEGAGERPLTQTRFGAALTERGIGKDKDTTTRRTIRAGIGLLT